MSVQKILRTTIGLALVIQVVESYYYREGLVAEPSCRLCKAITMSFEKIITMSVEENHKSTNERFSDLMQHVCFDVHETIQYECLEFANKYELLLYGWWKKDLVNSGFYKWLCIDELKVCCPHLHYGRNCTQCDGYPLPCSVQGICDGDATRTGDGHCICVEPYSGNKCETCVTGYYGTYEGSDLICKPCHKACQGGCLSKGPKGCRSCTPGWYWQDTKCVDVNECMNQKTCGARTYCVNTPGSYYCTKCHFSCMSCYGPALTECIECDDNYTFDYFKHTCVGTRFPNISYELMIALFIFGIILGAILMQFDANVICFTVVGLGIFIAILKVNSLVDLINSNAEQGGTNASHT